LGPPHRHHAAPTTESLTTALGLSHATRRRLSRCVRSMT
jgi:hypothetical protein